MTLKTTKRFTLCTSEYETNVTLCIGSFQTSIAANYKLGKSASVYEKLQIVIKGQLFLNQQILSPPSNMMELPVIISDLPLSRHSVVLTTS